MSNSNYIPKYEDIDGVEVSVQKRSREKFPEKEWLLTRIVEGRKQLPSSEKFKPQLSFTFEFLGEGYEGRKAWYNTPDIPFVGNNLYNLYMEVMGLKELPVGESFKPSKMIGRTCYVMMGKARKDPEKQVIDVIKHHDQKDVVAEVSKQSTGEVAKKEVKAQAVPSVAKQEPQSAAEDIDIGDITIDDIG